MSSDSNAKLRGRNVVAGILSGAVGRSASLVAPFLVMPELLGSLGEARFGVWMTVVSITSMAAFVDFGIGNGLLTQLSRAYGAQDHRQMRSIIASAYGMLGLISAMLLLAIGSLAALVEIGFLAVHFLTIEPESRHIIWVTLCAFAIGIPVSALHRILFAFQKNIQSNVLQIAGSAFAVIGCIFFIRAGSEPWLVVAVYAFAPLLCAVIGAIIFFRSNRAIQPTRADWSLQRARNLLALGSAFFVLSIITSIALNLDNLLIASRLGSAMVTEYAIPAKIASLLGLMVTTLFLPLWAANGEALQRHDLDWIRNSTQRMMLYGAVALGLAGVVMTITGEAVSRLWMSREFQGATEIFAMFAFLYLLFAIASPYQMLLNSAGKIKIQIYAWTIFLVLSSGGKYFALSTIGDVWVVPLVSAAAFAMCVMPLIIFNARKIYSND